MEQDLRRQVLNILEKNSRLSPAEIAVRKAGNRSSWNNL